MFTVPIDLLFATAKYVLYGLLLLMPICLLAGSRILERLSRRDTRIPSPLLTVRLLLATILLAVFLNLITITGQISLTCERQTAATCQRERTVIYGLFHQSTALDTLRPFKEYRTLRARDDFPDQLMLEASGQVYLLHPAHNFSRLERVVDGKNTLLTIDDALADMQSFQQGDAGTMRHYRDRVGIIGSLITVFLSVAILPILLLMGLFAEGHFRSGNRGRPVSEQENSVP